MNHKEIIERWNNLPFHKRFYLATDALSKTEKDYLEPIEIYNINKFKIPDQ